MSERGVNRRRYASGLTDTLAAYCRRTKRIGIADLNFYVAFGMFRMAAILHGIKGRLARGTAASARASEYAEALEWMAELAWRQVGEP